MKCGGIGILMLALQLFLITALGECECRQMIAIEESFKETLVGVGKEPDVLQESPKVFKVAIWDRGFPREERKLVARLSGGTKLYVLFKDKGAYQIESIADAAAKSVKGWIDRKYLGKPKLRDVKTLKLCE